MCGAMALAAGGCGVSKLKYEDLKAQNRIQQSRIDELEAGLQQCNASLLQKQQQLDAMTGRSGADAEARNAIVAALEADLQAKKDLIAQLQAQLLEGGAPLPAELNATLQEFAKNSDMIDFDEATGSLKFKSDLLFDLGSDVVAAPAAEALKALAGIMNADEAKQFDLVIVGHTDDAADPSGRNQAGTSDQLASVRPPVDLGTECTGSGRNRTTADGHQGVWRIQTR